MIVLAACGAAAAPAQAGVYTVYACDAAGRQWDNRSWTQGAPVGGIAADQDCLSTDRNIGINQIRGSRTAGGTQARLQFAAPAGTGIADFRLTKRIIFRNPAPRGERRYYVITALGGTPIEGAGDYPAGTRNRLHAQGRWYGYPQNNADTGVVRVSRASFPALAGLTPATPANALSVRIGCTRGSSPCGEHEPGAHRQQRPRRGDRRQRPGGAADMTVEASGLLRGGRQRLGSRHGARHRRVRHPARGDRRRHRRAARSSAARTTTPRPAASSPTAARRARSASPPRARS